MKKYNIGLDIGTTSVGWAVVEDGTQKIMRKGKKALWGVRLFEEAQTAAERRGYRSTRRRYDRRRNRIKLLQEEFNIEINQVDPNFFTKLKESKYVEKDEKNKTIKLTREEKLKVKQYYEKYPTIYHLRKELMTRQQKMDIRLVYLAIHHMIKYRGNFLYGNTSFNASNLNIKDSLLQTFDTLQNNIPELEIPDNYNEIIDFEQFSKILLIPSKNDMKVEIKKFLSDVCNKQFVSELIKLLAGNKFNINKLFVIENAENKIEINFNGSDFDDKYDEIEQLLGDKIESLQELKNLYDTLFLKKLFKGGDHVSLSELMVERYEQHQKDLRFLKDLFNKNRKIYNKLLRSTEKEPCVYEKYISNHLSREDFTKELTKLISLLLNSSLEINHNYIEQLQNDVKKRMENGDFLPRITDTENGKYPYQLNKDELIKVIENQGQYYPFLLNKTNDGVYKIVKLLEFKIPYYVGPLVSSQKSQFAWMERKQDHIKITPYNFDEVIDKEKTAEKFILRMISHCTYLLNEYALPNNSIYYSRYKVLNELKQIRVNNQRLSNEQQQYIIKELFEKTSGSITNNKFIEFLHAWNEMSMYDEIQVRGYSADNKFANSLQSYYDFFGPNGIFENTDYSEDDADQIIEWITIFEDKDVLESKVRREYSELSDSQIKKILTRKYTGWGNLSRELLSTKYYKDKETNTYKSIMDLMNETEENFMQIINNDKYKFQKMIQEKNNATETETLSYKVVEPLATSPATKRGIYQALKIVKELVDYIGYEPARIMIEMARSEEKKQRTLDRKKYIEKLYDKCKNEIEDYKRLMDELSHHEINTQKLFLYFIQEGKCLYSGKPLDIEDLDKYEIDHIIPRTLIKDDSIDNKALVYRECNQEKAASYVLPSSYRKNMYKWWEHLKDHGLISAKKFHNLIRSSYKDEDIQGFINRQLVETRQITKHVANILNNYYKKTKVVYLKANLSHNYRERYDLFKFRNINDYHHAHDAYLAAVLGEYKEKYMKKEINFHMVKEMNDRFRMLGQNNKLKYGYVINSLDEDASDIVNEISKNLIDEETGEIKFEAHSFNQRVEDTLYRNDILISRKTELNQGKFFKETIYQAGKGSVSIKENMPVKLYGGYSNVNTSYLCLVKFKNKVKMVGIPIQIDIKMKQNKITIEQFIREHLKLKDNDIIEIIKCEIPFQSEIKYKGQLVYIKGYSIGHRNCELSNACQLKINKENMIKWKYALEFLENNNKKFELDAQTYVNQILQYLLAQKNNFPLFEKELNIIESQIKLLNLDLLEKKKIINEIFKMLHCNSVNANLKEFELGDRMGRLSGCSVTEGTLINKSITGIKEQKYEF